MMPSAIADKRFSLLRQLRQHGLVGAIRKSVEVFRREGAGGFARRVGRSAQIVAAPLSPAVPSTQGAIGGAGINLIGHPLLAFGMGEHVRKSAHAFASAEIPFVLINTFQIKSHADKLSEFPFAEQAIRANPYPVSLFHLNADEMPLASAHLGASFFEERYNIGFSTWELSKFPDAWLPSFRFFDEVWAPSRFVQQAMADKASCTVIHMPLAVEAAATTVLPRRHFGLPENRFLFLFMFDFTSYVARKNPLGAYAAFRSAFGNAPHDAALVIKVNGTDQRPQEYRAFLRALGDRRNSVLLIDRLMTDQEVRNLVRNCDCFVSLHRSEGFGRGMAEAMFYGKPVIATGYSGNTDFTHENNACLVDYTLVPVKEGEYPFSAGQLWAQPDVEQAAWFMRKLTREREFGTQLGARASQYIRNHHSFRAVGERYRRRLAKLGFASRQS